MRFTVAVAVACLIGGVSIADDARASIRKPTNISAQNLGEALQRLAHDRDLQVVYFSAIIDTLETQGAVGDLTTDEAFTKLLSGTGLTYRYLGDKTITILSIAEASRRDGRADSPASRDEKARGEKKSFSNRFRVAAKDGSTVVKTIASGPASDEHDAAADGASNRSPDARSDERIELQEIVVTAQHRSEKLHDVPVAITALSGDYLEQRQDRSFEEYAATVPGLALKQQSPGVNTLTLRGLNANGTGSTVSVYVDDSPVGSTSGLANASLFAANFDPWDMQRIEVLRGPQGTLYGASSEGGLIKFVTNAPDLKEFAGRAEVGADNITHGGNGWSGKLMVNAPLGSIAALRVSAYSETFPGYVDDPLRHQSDLNTSKKNGIRTSLLLQPTSDLMIRLTAFRQEIKTDGTFAVDVNDNTRQPAFGPFTQERLIPEPVRFTYNLYNATVDWNLGWASVLSSTSYGRDSNRLFADASLRAAGSGMTYSDLVSSLFGVPLGFSITNQSEVQKLTQEVRLQSLSNARLEWEVGGYFTREKAQLYQLFDLFNISDGSLYGGQPGALGIANVDTMYKEWAGFATLTYHINPKVDVQVGGRWAHNDQKSLEVDGSPPFQTLNPSAASAGKFLYSFAPRWHVSDDLLLYGRIASGYKAGGPNTVPSDAPPGFPLQFKPDSTVNYEVGMRNRPFNQRLSIDLTAFRIDWSKVQINASLPGTSASGLPFSFTGNGGGARSQGLEYALALVPLQDLTLSLTGAYVDAKLTTPAPAVGGVTGQRLPGSPDWSSSLDAEYGHHAFADYRGFVGGTLSYTGSVFTDFSATYKSTVPPTRIPGYSTLNLRTGLQNERWRLSLYAKNVTNRRALQLFYSSGDSTIPAEAYFTAPREIGGTVSFKF